MIRALNVYLYDAHVATIVRRGENLQLRYLPEYVESDSPVPISVTLPVVTTPFGNEATKRFLDNLMPDRADVRSRWAREAKLTSDSTFDLLSVYGADVAGALEFYPTGTSPRQEENLTPLTEKEIGDRIRQIRRDDSDWLQHRAVEEGFSLGGAQGKFALTLRDDQWFEPSGRQPSTHIFKPGMQPLPGSDVTEHITLQVARLLGINAAASVIAEFDGEHVLIAERFDRFDDNGAIGRLHQEDLAQATGTSHVQKHESDGGPGYRDIFIIFDRNLSAAYAKIAKERFAKLHVFSWIIGHNDGHSKNYSLTHVPGRSASTTSTARSRSSHESKSSPTILPSSTTSRSPSPSTTPTPSVPSTPTASDASKPTQGLPKGTCGSSPSSSPQASSLPSPSSRNPSLIA